MQAEAQKKKKKIKQQKANPQNNNSSITPFFCPLRYQKVQINDGFVCIIFSTADFKSFCEVHINDII